MYNLTTILNSIRTARDTTSTARDDWNTKVAGADDWQAARSIYFQTEEKYAVLVKRLLRVVKVLARTDTLHLYLDFTLLSAEQTELLSQVLRENKHDRLLETEFMPTNNFVALAHAWKIEQDRLSAAQELCDIERHHDDLDPVIKHRAKQSHPRGWRLAIRAFRITRIVIGGTVIGAAPALDTHECSRAAIDMVKSRAEERFAKLTQLLESILQPRLNHPYLLDALLESIMPIQASSSEEDEAEGDDDPFSYVSREEDRLGVPESSAAFQKRVEEAREVVDALRSAINTSTPEPEPENKFSVPVKTLDEGEEEVEPAPNEEEAEAEQQQQQQQQQEQEEAAEAAQDEEQADFQPEVPTITPAELEDLFNLEESQPEKE